MGLSHTVSGDIASFRTPSRVPIESLKFHFLPKQEGSGDPSPSNERPIIGWTGLNGYKAGKNLVNKVNVINGYFSSRDGKVVIYASDAGRTVWMPCKQNTVYACSKMQGGNRFSMYCTEEKPARDVECTPVTKISSIGYHQYILRTPENAKYLCLFVWLSSVDTEITDQDMIDSVQVELGNAVSSFEPYSGSAFPVTFPMDDENKFNATIKNGNIASDGKEIASSNSRLITNGFMYLPAGMYTLSSQQNYPCAIYVYSDQDEDSYVNTESLSSWNNSPVVFTLTIGRYIRLKWKNDDDTKIVPSDLTNIQIKLCTFYGGGYYDPVVGEIVCSWRKFKVKDYEWTYKEGNHRFQIQLASYEKANAASAGWTNFAISDSYKPSTYAGYADLMIAGYGNNYIYIRDDRYTSETDFVEAMGEVEIAYELANPIHIPITPQDLQVFLDHNNFWSDANDITEVTYAVTESKDILATRKKAMDFDIAHHKKVKWNQIQIDGNFQDKNKWAANNNGSISNSDGIMTWTCDTQPTQFYQTGFYIKESAGFVAIPYNHKIIITADVRCSVSTRVRLYGLVSTNGNTYIYSYYNNNANIPANEWTHLIGFISDRPETPPSSATDTIIKRFKPTMQGTNGDISTITVGTTMEVKNFMAFDLTQMFGLGNEPSTVAEFEHICEINGIDLTAYQPYDTGSDRWLIIP